MIDWVMVGALGTIFAAVVALGLGLSDTISRHLNKPDIVLEHLPDEKYVTRFKWPAEQHEKFGGDQEDWWEFNLTLRNKASTTAKTPRVRIENIIQKGSKLMTSYYFNKILFERESLQHDESLLFPLIRIDFIRNTETLYFPECGNFSIERKNFKITLLVTGDNFKAYRKTFEFIYDSIDRDKIELIEIFTVLETRYPFHTA